MLKKSDSSRIMKIHQKIQTRNMANDQHKQNILKYHKLALEKKQQRLKSDIQKGCIH